MTKTANKVSSKKSDDVTEVKKEPKVNAVEPKVFKDSDVIRCVSITSGGLYMVGAKSNDLYSWSDIGDVVEVEYRDLISAVRTRDSLVYYPRFIIDDPEFLKQHSAVQDVYNELYTPEDIKSVINMSPVSMKSAIAKMPAGAQDALKGMAMTMIDNGELDSVQRVKVLDEFFGTQMLLKLTN